MISVLIIIVALVAAMTGADVPVYSEETGKMLRLSNPYSDLTSAKLLNSDKVMGFRVRQPKEDDSEFIVLLPQSRLVPWLEGQSNTCGDNLGIQLSNSGPTICGISLFIISGLYSYKSDTYSMELVVVFGLESDTPFTLKIPLLRIPSELASENKKDELKAWATEHSLGLHSPVDSQTLSDIRANNPVTLDFSCLNELLAFGIQNRTADSVKAGTNDETLSFVSRPIALSNVIIDGLSEVIPFLDE